MQDDARRKMENKLIVMGLKRLDDPELIPQMALLIKDDEFFMGMLNECDVEKRSEMYYAIRPYLKFKPKSLDWYIIQLTERANAIASQAEPVMIGERKLQQVAPTDATGVVVDLTCTCGRSNSYFGDTPLVAVVLARQDGWVRDRATNKEVCPKCECADRGERRKCPTCGRRHYPPTCRYSAKTDKDVTQMAASMILLTDA